MVRISKITSISLVVLLLTAALSIGVSAAGTAVLVSTDNTTGGDWVGKYGSEGHIIITEDGSLQSIPAYATLEYMNEWNTEPAFWTWWDSEDGDEENEEHISSALFKTANRASRLAACFYSGGFVSVTVDIGSESKLVALYMMDYDRQSREVTVTAYDDNGVQLANPISVYDYGEGRYLIFKISGKVQFMIENMETANATISGIFFDTDSDAIVEETPATAEIPATVPEEPVPIPQQTVEITAPRTVDPIILLVISSIISASGIIITRRKSGAK